MSEASGLSWLEGRTWAEVTREERFFCAELFFVIRQDVPAFVQFLDQEEHWVKRTGRGVNSLEINANWDPAYEACFYRDMGRLDVSRKRTFDLALFSDKTIILIEAKAHQGFDNKQLKSMARDRDEVAKLTGHAEVLVAGIMSSGYKPKPETRTQFDLVVTWNDLARRYGTNEPVKRAFDRADGVYGDSVRKAK